MTDLQKLRAAVAEDEYIHEDKLEREFGVEPWWGYRSGVQVLRGDALEPQPATCVFCNARWTPEMIELVELSGYCETCSDSERVIDVFCSACTRLVYRKEVS